MLFAYIYYIGLSRIGHMFYLPIARQAWSTWAWSILHYSILLVTTWCMLTKVDVVDHAIKLLKAILSVRLCLDHWSTLELFKISKYISHHGKDWCPKFLDAECYSHEVRGSHLLQTEWVCYLQEIVFIVGYFSSASCVMTTLVTSLLHCYWLCCLNIYIMATNSNTKLCTSWQSVHIFQWPSNTFNISKKLFAVNSATVIYTLHTCSHNRNEMFLLHNILGFSVRLLHNKLMGWDMRNVIKSNIE